MKKAVILVIVLLLGVPLIGRAAPETVKSIRAAVAPEVYGNSRDALLSVGQTLSGEETGGAQYVLSRSAAEDFPLKRMVALNLMSFKIPVVLTETSAAPAMAELQPPAPQQSTQSDAVQSAPDETLSAEVESFLARQAAFSGSALPESISRSDAPLPFEYVAPVSAEIGSRFGFRQHPIYGDVRFHYGTDFSVQDGHEIAAFADGVVKTAGDISGYGLALVIEHPGGYETLYGHCSELLVSPGEAVAAGQLVALSGRSGLVTGPHMHFELKCNGSYLNPEFYL